MPRRVRPLCLASIPLASLLALPSTASADRVEGTRSEELVERDHEIRLVLDHGVATLRARRTVHNGGPRHDQAVMWLYIPETSVATGLRTKGTLHGRDHWFAGQLMDAELAAARYAELTGIGGYYPKDPALLSWRDPTELVLQVFPVAPGTDKMVEYTLQMPTHYEDGRDHLTLPSLGTEEHPARVTLQTTRTSDQLFVDGVPVTRGHQLTLDEETTLSLARRDPPRIDASLASVVFGDGRVLMRYDVALAPELSTVPRDARVVIVLDGSRSLEEDERRAARRIARGYLRHFEAPALRARAEVLVFDHEVHARHDGFVPAREALADLLHVELPEANGSQVDDALSKAADLLAKSGRGPRRILLLTDALTRADLQPERLQALAERSGAIVHVGLVTAAETALDRDDDHQWAPVATATGGVVWNVSTDPDLPSADDHRVFEELARPVRIDHLSVGLPPIETRWLEVPETLPEGQGLEALQIVEDSIDHLRIEGQLWSMPLRETVFPDEDHERRWSALVFGSELLDQLSEPEMTTLAIRGGAVSPMTSYLAIEPGVRPSTEGLDEGEIGLGMSGIGFGRGGGSGSGRAHVGRSRGEDDRQERLERAVRASLDACGGRGRSAHVELETTFVEIVAMPRVEVGSDDPLLVPCLRQGLWSMMLDPDFRDLHRVWTVELPAT